MAFISHCGKNSFYESLFHGIPPICVPNFGDQFYNAETGAKHGYGSVLDFYCIELNVRGQKQFTIPYNKSSGNIRLLPLPK
jgi:UDP:flavonoid glycosyltransferase YjiC (YdhE family)